MANTSIIYGKHVVTLLLQHEPSLILELRAFKPQEWTTLVKATKLPIKLKTASLDELKMATQGDFNHQGIVAIVKPFAYLPWKPLQEDLRTRNKDLILILDKIQDPQNFGTIIRSALLLGVKNIIIGSHQQAMVNATVIKASAGTAYLLPITIAPNLNQAIAQLKKSGYWIYSSNLNHKAIDCRKIDYAQKTVLIVGNEHQGVSDLVTKNSDVNLFIPTTQKIDSLNVATATAIALFQISSQLDLI